MDDFEESIETSLNFNFTIDHHDHDHHSHHNHSHQDHNDTLTNLTTSLLTTTPPPLHHLDHPISVEKWTAMGVLTGLSIIFGIFPYLLFSYYRRVIRTDSSLCKVVLAALSSISGGFLLAVTMLHILPEVREKATGQAVVLSNLLQFLGAGGSGGSHVPPAEMLMLLGFCLIYGLEEIAQFLLKIKCSCGSHSLRRKLRIRKHGHHHHHKHNSTHIRQEYGNPLGNKLDSLKTKHGDILMLDDCQHVELISRPECNTEKNIEDSCGDSPDMSMSTTLTHSHSDTDNDSGKSSGLGSAPSSSPAHLRASVLTLNNLQKEIMMSTPLGVLRSIVSLLALSLHAIMEGVAVGVQPDKAIWMTFGAIASHKCIIALVLGMEMMKSGMNWKMLVGSILIFSFVSPLGILIGSVMVSGDLAQSGWVVVIEGLATGTLVYIIFFEILPPSHDHSSGHNESSSSKSSSDDVSRGRDVEDLSYHDNDNPHDKDSKLEFQGLLRFFGTFVGVLLAAYLISLSPHSHGSPSPLKDVHEHEHDEHEHVH